MSQSQSQKPLQLYSCVPWSYWLNPRERKSTSVREFVNGFIVGEYDEYSQIAFNHYNWSEFQFKDFKQMPNKLTNTLLSLFQSKEWFYFDSFTHNNLIETLRVSDLFKYYRLGIINDKTIIGYCADDISNNNEKKTTNTNTTQSHKDNDTNSKDKKQSEIQRIQFKFGNTIFKDSFKIHVFHFISFCVFFVFE